MAQLKTWHLLAVTHLAAGLAGFALAPSEPMDSVVAHTGLFSADTTRTLAAAVLSLSEENRLQVYSYRGIAHVTAHRSELLGLLGAEQSLILPATVSYFLELSGLGIEDLQWDEATATVMVRLRPLVMGEVAVHAELAVIKSGGVLSYSDRHVQDLARLNFGRARSAFIRQAQQATLVEAAQRHARANIERDFGMALRVAGRPEVRVVATFGR